MRSPPARCCLLWLVFFAALVCVTGCAEPVAKLESYDRAEQIVGVLDDIGVSAQVVRVRDGWTLRVASPDRERALAALERISDGDTPSSSRLPLLPSAESRWQESLNSRGDELIDRLVAIPGVADARITSDGHRRVRISLWIAGDVTVNEKRAHGYVQEELGETVEIAIEVLDFGLGLPQSLEPVGPFLVRPNARRSVLWASIAGGLLMMAAGLRLYVGERSR